MKLWMCVFGLVLLVSAQSVQCQDESEDVKEAENADPVPAEDAEGGEDAVTEENDVLVLTEANFDGIIAKHETILVEFYAPWCGHCKQLAPEYEKAAAQLKQADPAVALAKVDATIESSLGGRFDVKGYPTLKFFKNGKMFDFDGPRTADGIVAYMEERATSSWAPPPDAVITLTTDTFDEVINRESLILVEFYAPWCGHCKKLAPEYEKAAQDLLKLPEPIALAKVDATEEPDLASKYGVSGYPTMKMFRKGVEFEYKGGRDRHTIVEYMTGQQGPPSKELSTANEVRSKIKEGDVVVVGLFESKDDALFGLYDKAVNDLREDYTLVHSFDKDTRNHYKANAGSVLLFHAEKFHSKHEPKWHVLQIEEGTGEKDVTDFIEKNNVPLVGHYNSQTKVKSYAGRRPLLVMFYTVDFGFDHREATQLWRLKLADIAKDYRDMTFAIADEDEAKDLVKEFGFEDSGEEINVGIVAENSKKYPMELFDSFDSDDVRDFIERYRNGDVNPRLRSQPIPKKSKIALKTLVGKNFEQIVMDKSKDVLVEFYAPWCGHCKSFDPKYKAFAKGLKNEKNLVLAKMDATANDYPEGYEVEGFPTIYFAPAGSDKNKPVKYSGNRDEDDLLKFLKDHATASFKSGKEEL